VKPLLSSRPTIVPDKKHEGEKESSLSTWERVYGSERFFRGGKDAHSETTAAYTRGWAAPDFKESMVNLLRTAE